jgi:hypothetical protein
VAVTAVTAIPAATTVIAADGDSVCSRKPAGSEPSGITAQAICMPTLAVSSVSTCNSTFTAAEKNTLYLRNGCRQVQARPPRTGLHRGLDDGQRDRRCPP